MKVKVTQLCPTLCDPLDYTFHVILQARILEWVAFPFSKGSSQPRMEPRSPALQVDSLPAEPQGKPKNIGVGSHLFSRGSSRPKIKQGYTENRVAVTTEEEAAAQSCPALCDPVDDTVPGRLQARILEWVAFPFSRGSSQPRDLTQVSRTAGVFFTS